MSISLRERLRAVAKPGWLWTGATSTATINSPRRPKLAEAYNCRALRSQGSASFELTSVVKLLASLSRQKPGNSLRPGFFIETGTGGDYAGKTPDLAETRARCHASDPCGIDSVERCVVFVQGTKRGGVMRKLLLLAAGVGFLAAPCR